MHEIYVGGVRFGPPERKLVQLPQIFIIFSKRYYDSPSNQKNKFLRFSTSDSFIYNLFLKHVPIFDELPKYIMQYLVTAWVNK